MDNKRSQPILLSLSSLSRWYPHPELNRDQRFRKPPLYPFELWGQATVLWGFPPERPKSFQQNSNMSYRPLGPEPHENHQERVTEGLAIRQGGKHLLLGGSAGDTPFQGRHFTRSFEYVYRNNPYHPGSSSIARRRRLLLRTPLI